MEEIRGVSVDGVIGTLVERELAEVVGRADGPEITERRVASGRRVDDLRASERERAGLVQDQAVDPSHRLEGRGALDEQAAPGADARARDQGERRREPHRAGTADQQRRRGEEDAGGERVGHGEPGRGADRPPEDAHENGDDDHGRDEDRRDTIDAGLDRCAAGLGLADEAGDVGEDGGFADGTRLDDQRALAVDGARVGTIAGSLANGQALAREHRLVGVAVASEDHAVHGEPLAGPDVDGLAGQDLGDGALDDLAVPFYASELRLLVEEGADRTARLPFAARLEDLPDEHERHDHRCGFEVDGEAGRVRARQQRGEAVEEGDARAEGDERVHVGRAGSCGAPGADVEVASDPERDS